MFNKIKLISTRTIIRLLYWIQYNTMVSHKEYIRKDCFD